MYCTSKNYRTLLQTAYQDKASNGMGLLIHVVELVWDAFYIYSYKWDIHTYIYIYALYLL